jgi:hypothetical protein
MSSLLRAFFRLAAVLSVGGLPFVAFGQSVFSPQGGEYAIIGSLPGDQVFPNASVNAAGGFVVWQDNATDGDGLGISARQLNSSLSGTLSPFRVN